MLDTKTGAVPGAACASDPPIAPINIAKNTTDKARSVFLINFPLNKLLKFIFNMTSTPVKH